jgi:hypothetical protein
MSIGTLPMPRPFNVFIAYASKDEEYIKELEEHLQTLKNQKIIRTWHSGRVTPGAEWEAEIYRQLRNAEIILLLISSSFIASDFCNSHYMSNVMAIHKSGQSKVVPILVRDCDWQGALFGNFQILPRGYVPIARWANRDEAFTEISLGLREVIFKIEEEIEQEKVRKQELEFHEEQKQKRALKNRIILSASVLAFPMLLISGMKVFNIFQPPQGSQEPSLGLEGSSNATSQLVIPVAPVNQNLVIAEDPAPTATASPVIPSVVPIAEAENIQSQSTDVSSYVSGSTWDCGEMLSPLPSPRTTETCLMEKANLLDAVSIINFSEPIKLDFRDNGFMPSGETKKFGELIRGTLAANSEGWLHVKCQLNQKITFILTNASNDGKLGILLYDPTSGYVIDLEHNSSAHPAVNPQEATGVTLINGQTAYGRRPNPNSNDIGKYDIEVQNNGSSELNFELATICGGDWAY